VVDIGHRCSTEYVGTDYPSGTTPLEAGFSGLSLTFDVSLTGWNSNRANELSGSGSSPDLFVDNLLDALQRGV